MQVIHRVSLDKILQIRGLYYLMLGRKVRLYVRVGNCLFQYGRLNNESWCAERLFQGEQAADVAYTFRGYGVSVVKVLPTGPNSQVVDGE